MRRITNTVEVMKKKEVISYIVKLCEREESFDITLSASADPLHGENQYGIFGINYFQKASLNYKTEFLLFGSYDAEKNILSSFSLTEINIEAKLNQWLSFLPDEIYVNTPDLRI